MTAVDLYESDYVAWTEAQSEALRSAAREGSNRPLDWEHLAEEIESLGRSQREQLGSRIATIIEHLMKLEHSPAQEPRRGRIETVLRERDRVDRLLRQSPSLAVSLPETIAEETPRAARIAAYSLASHGEMTPEIQAALGGAVYSPAEVLQGSVPG